MEYDNSSHDGWGHGDGHGSSGLSFANLFAGLELGAGLTGHSLSIADAAAAAIAIDVAIGHGGPAELHGYESGYLHDMPALARSGWHGPDGLSSGSLGRELSLPGIARDATAVEVLSWPHGACNDGLGGPQEQVRQLATQASMVPFPCFDINIAGFREIDQTEEGIVSVRSDSRHRHALPNGWYRGATGKTHIWREFFRIRPSRFPFFGRPDNFESRRTFLIVSGATWFYDQTEDYETRVRCSVYSLPFTTGGRWTYRWDQIKEYRGLAERLARAIREYLEQHRASATSIECRQQMGAEVTEPTVLSANGQHPRTTSASDRTRR